MVLTEDLLKELKRFQDDQGRITLFPSKTRNKIIALLYLSTKFKQEIIYSEKEVNDIIEQHHTFQNKWLLRRELVDRGFLQRKKDGSAYWVPEVLPTFELL